MQNGYFLELAYSLSALFIITCSNGAEDKNHTTTNIPGKNSGTTITVGQNKGAINPTNNAAETINYGDKVSGDKIGGDKILGDKIGGDKHVYNSPPSYREATIVQGDNGNPVGVTDNPNVLNNAIKLLTRLSAGEDVNIQEAYNATSPKFILNSGTEISRLESSGTGFAEFVKVKILEGAHKNETGWIHASTIHQEQRQK